MNLLPSNDALINSTVENVTGLMAPPASSSGLAAGEERLVPPGPTPELPPAVLAVCSALMLVNTIVGTPANILICVAVASSK